MLKRKSYNLTLKLNSDIAENNKSINKVVNIENEIVTFIPEKQE